MANPGILAYNTKYTYDANGNMATLVRNGRPGIEAMDNLVYQYDLVDDRKVNNRLNYVDDTGTDPLNYADDIEDQDVGNYGYDLIGNLISDNEGQIDNISWNIANKIQQVTRPNGSGSSNLRFSYDGLGNRIMKISWVDDGLTIPDYIHTWYVRDAGGNILATYSWNTGETPELTEQYIYGATRLGYVDRTSAPTQPNPTHAIGLKKYELTNHLGNVLTIVSDRPYAVADASNTMVAGYIADIKTSQDYYAGGSLMPGRNYNPDAYRFGAANGQEKVDEIAGSGNHYTAPYWEYDPRIVRRWNVDPVVKHDQSGYSVFANNPVWLIDPNGADTSFSNNESRTFVLDLVNPDSENYNKDFANHFQSLVDDKESVFNFDKWNAAKKERTRKIFGNLSASGRNDAGQNLINIGFSLESSSQGHMLGALFEETDHAVQFQQGRLGFFEMGGSWGTGDSYDLNDEVDNKIWTANALNSFGSNSIYKKSLFGLNNKIVKGASRRYVTRKVGISYSNLNKENIGIFQAIQIMTSGAVSEDAARKTHMIGGGYSNILIGIPRK